MKQPATSLEAYKSVTVEMKNKHYGQILKALKQMGSGTYEEIALFIGLGTDQVGRRLKEMRDDNLLYISGLKRPTKKGRGAFVHYLTSDSQPKTEREINYSKVKTTAVEYANKIIELTQQSLF